MKALFLISLSLLALACGSERYCCDCVTESGLPTPEVRLVKDSPTTFHFQWKEPLTEERIILVRIRKVGAHGSGPGGLTNPHLMDEDTHLLRFETTLYQPTQFRSRRFSILAVDYPSIPSGLAPFVEILPERERYDIQLPAISRSATGGSGDSMSGGFSYELFAEHPFKPYELGEPSKLVFTSEDNQ